MKDFSIDVEAENIFDQRTREYFQEVLGSFVNGNYRSAVVMLWSVVVADLIYSFRNYATSTLTQQPCRYLRPLSRNSNPTQIVPNGRYFSWIKSTKNWSCLKLLTISTS